MDDSLIVRISSLEHYMYCPRQCALIEVEGQWIDNRHTIRGEQDHRRADSGVHSRHGAKHVLRSVPLWSEHLGLSGRADIIEVRDAGLLPVEYKSGVRHGDAADIQVCAQALCLEEMFDVAIPIGAIWYGSPRRRHAVALDAALRSKTKSVIAAVRDQIVTGQLPPAVPDRRCDQCQLEPRCLPGIVARPTRSQLVIDSIMKGSP